MAANANSVKDQAKAAATVVAEKSRTMWDATAQAAAKPVVRETAKLVGQVALGTLVVMATVKAVNAVAAL